MEVFQSKKRIDGFSTCFRQYAAEGTHCKFLHGYNIYFDVTFEGELDQRNWVADFGFMKRSVNKIRYANALYDGINGSFFEELTPDEWFKKMFDHTVVLAHSDPALDRFIELDKAGIIKLRLISKVGCEMFAERVYDQLNEFIYRETNGRVRVVEVECFEHAKNSAIYKTSK